MSMPDSAEFSASVKFHEGLAAAEELGEGLTPKFWLMTVKAASNLTRETSSISLIEAWVFSMDSSRSRALGFEEAVALGGLRCTLRAPSC